MKKIAVIGTGIMGAGIASNFLKNGYEVYVWNRDKEKLNDLIKNGAKVLDNPKNAPELADIVFEVTANDESSQSVWTGDTGILAGATKDSVLITCSTLSIKWTEELAKLCQDKNLIFFDMPMTGGRAGAETGNLILLTGGSEQKIEELKPVLKAVAKEVLYFGETGSGMKFKLLLNMLQAIHIAGLGEVLKVAKANNMNLKAVGDALAVRPGGTTTTLAWRDYQNVPNPINFSVKWITKDLEYAKKLSGKEDLPLLDDVLNRYYEAIEKGMADDDWTAINR